MVIPENNVNQEGENDNLSGEEGKSDEDEERKGSEFPEIHIDNTKAAKEFGMEKDNPEEESKEPKSQDPQSSTILI